MTAVGAMVAATAAAARKGVAATLEAVQGQPWEQQWEPQHLEPQQAVQLLNLSGCRRTLQAAAGPVAPEAEKR